MVQTQNGVLQKDDNGYPVMGGTSSLDDSTIINSALDPVTRRLLTDSTGGGGSTPGGPDMSVQFNDGGNFAGDAGFLFDSANTLIMFGTQANGGTIISPDGGSNENGVSFNIGSGNGIGIGDGGGFNMFSGDAEGTGNGGVYQVTAGAGGLVSGDGGDVTIVAGGAQAGNSNGGIIGLTPGIQSGGGTPGDIRFIDPQTNNDAIFDTTLLTNDRTFAFPDQSGTFALLSDIGGSFVDNEIVSGSGTSFTLANTPVAGSQHVYGNGQRLTPVVDYTISGTAISIVSPATYSAGAVLADYRK